MLSSRRKRRAKTANRNYNTARLAYSAFYVLLAAVLVQALQYMWPNLLVSPVVNLKAKRSFANVSLDGLGAECEAWNLSGKVNVSGFIFPYNPTSDVELTQLSRCISALDRLLPKPAPVYFIDLPSNNSARFDSRFAKLLPTLEYCGVHTRRRKKCIPWDVPSLEAVKESFYYEARKVDALAFYYLAFQYMKWNETAIENWLFVKSFTDTFNYLQQSNMTAREQKQVQIDINDAKTLLQTVRAKVQNYKEALSLILQELQFRKYLPNNPWSEGYRWDYLCAYASERIAEERLISLWSKLMVQSKMFFAAVPLGVRVNSTAAAKQGFYVAPRVDQSNYIANVCANNNTRDYRSKIS